MQPAIKQRMKRIHARVVDGRSERWRTIEQLGPRKIKFDNMPSGIAKLGMAGFLAMITGRKTLKRFAQKRQ
jgi:hypothetical protein